MDSTLGINSGTAAKLLDIAKAQNVSVEQLLKACVPGLSDDAKPAPLTPEEKVRALDKWIAEFPETPPLSDEAISRASIYSDR
jgi:hypothetical protein